MWQNWAFLLAVIALGIGPMIWDDEVSRRREKRRRRLLAGE